MREKSHLDDMRSAVRGDFERLAERRGGQELMQAPAEEPEPQPVDDPPRPEDPASGSWLSRLERWLTYSGVDRGPPTDGGAV